MASVVITTDSGALAVLQNVNVILAASFGAKPITTTIFGTYSIKKNDCGRSIIQNLQQSITYTFMKTAKITLTIHDGEPRNVKLGLKALMADIRKSESAEAICKL